MNLSTHRDWLKYSQIDSPIGSLMVAATALGLSYIDFSDDLQSFILKLEKNHAKSFEKIEKDCSYFSPFHNELALYFQGKLIQFNTRIDFLTGTAWQQKVWRKLIDIPYGETRSYKWVAQEIGNSKAVRAVGQANSKNPVPIVLPCHRVIAHNGKIGGYSGGLDKKRFLLGLEEIGKRDYLQVEERQSR